MHTIRPHDHLTSSNAFQTGVENFLYIGAGKEYTLEAGKIGKTNRDSVTTYTREADETFTAGESRNTKRALFSKIMHVVVLVVLSVFTIIALAIRAAHRASIVQPQIDNIEINNQLKVIQDAIASDSTASLKPALRTLHRLATTQDKHQFIFTTLDRMGIESKLHNTGPVMPHGLQLNPNAQSQISIGDEIFFTGEGRTIRAVVTKYVDGEVTLKYLDSRKMMTEIKTAQISRDDVLFEDQGITYRPGMEEKYDGITATANLIRNAFELNKTRLHDEDVAAEAAALAAQTAAQVATHIDFIDAHDNGDGTAEMTEELRAAYAYVLEHGADNQVVPATMYLDRHRETTQAQLTALMHQQEELAVKPVTLNPSPPKHTDARTITGIAVKNPETLERVQAGKFSAAWKFIQAHDDLTTEMGIALGVLRNLKYNDNPHVQEAITKKQATIQSRVEQREACMRSLAAAQTKSDRVAVLLANS